MRSAVWIDVEIVAADHPLGVGACGSRHGSDDGFDLALDQKLIETMNLIQVAYDQAVRGHGGAVAEAEIIVNPDIVAALKK